MIARHSMILHILCSIVCRFVGGGSPARSSCCLGGPLTMTGQWAPLHQPAWHRVQWQHLVAPPDGGDGRQAGDEKVPGQQENVA